jgi:hypothetical protein
MSEESALSEALSAASSSTNSRCVSLDAEEEEEYQDDGGVSSRLNRRHVVAPDVHDWHSVGGNVNSVRDFAVPTEVSAKIEESKRYQLLVKAIYDDGDEVVTRSHSFGARALSLRASQFGDCGGENICRVQRTLVRDILTERFGPTKTIFNFVPGEPVDDDDDDDGLSGGAIAGITVSVVFFVLLVLIVLLAFARGRSNTAFRSDGVAGVTEAERTGPRGALKTDDQNTAVVIQYPDTGLDLDREIAADGVDADAATEEGKRPTLTGVLESKTPSGRDFSTAPS